MHLTHKWIGWVAYVAVFVSLALISCVYVLFIDMSPYLLAVHAGAIPLYFALALRRRFAALLLSTTSILSVVGAATLGSGLDRGNACRILVITTGLVAIFLLLASSVRAKGGERKFARQSLLAVFGMHAAVSISRIILLVVSDSHPVTFDRYLYACDASFGVQFSFAAGRLFSFMPWLREFCFLVYLALPFGVLFLFANLRGESKARWLLLGHFALIGIVGRFCYSAVPAMGPIYLFPSHFPWNPPSVSSLVLEPLRLPRGLRNAMPSLHFAWAFMLLLWTGGQRMWLRVSAALFLVFTLFATLGLGEHYMVDLVVAVPFSVFTFALVFALLPGRGIAWVPLGIGLGLFVLWLALLRSSGAILAAHPQAVLGLSALTLGLSIRVIPWPDTASMLHPPEELTHVPQVLQNR